MCSGLVQPVIAQRVARFGLRARGKHRSVSVLSALRAGTAIG